MDSVQDDLVLSIKCDQGKLEIKPLKHENPNADNADDRSWIYTAVTVRVGGFVASYATSIRDVEFAILARELKHCYANLNRSFDFEVLESSFRLKVKGDGLGHFLLSGKCNQYNATLSFDMTFDQSFLPKMIDELEEINKRFPYDRKQYRI